MDDLGVRRERRRLAGHAIVEATADIEQHVAALNRAVHVHPAVHARHAEGQRMVLRECAHPWSVVMTGIPVRSANAISSARRAGLDDPVADEEQRTLGIGDQLGRRVHRRRIDVGHAMIHVALEVERDDHRDDARLLRVLRDVDEHRTRPPDAAM